MTHFPDRSQQSVPSEPILEGSGVFQKQLAFQSSIQDRFRQVSNAWSAAIDVGGSRSQLSLRGPACHGSLDDSCRVIVLRIVQLSFLLAHQRQSTVLTLSTPLSNQVSANGFFFNTYACHEGWHRSCLEESCDASNGS